MRITIGRADLERAAAGIVEPETAGAIWEQLAREQGRSETPRGGGLDLSTVAWWGGALLVIVAMLALVPLLMERYGRHVLLAAALLYGAAFAVAAWWLWFRARLETAGGLMATLAVCMAPPVVLGIMVSAGVAGEEIGLPPGGGIAMEAAAIAAGLAALIFVRFTFLLVPVILGLWVMLYDVALNVLGYDCDIEGGCAAISFWYGAVLVAAGYAMDHLLRDDYAFWGYFFGALGMVLSLFVMAFVIHESDGLRALFALMSLAMVLAAIVLRREVLAVFGTMGVLAYLLYLIWDLFEGSLAFPLALSAAGVAMVFGGVQWHRHRTAAIAATQRRLPAFLRALQPPRRP